MKTERQMVSVGDVITVLYCLPLAVLGLAWLAAVTDFSLNTAQILYLVLHGVLILLLDRLNFFLIIELRNNRYGSADGSLDNVILWAAVFIIGPTAIWLSILIQGIEFAIHWREGVSTAARWNRMRSLVLTLASTCLSYLVAMRFYAQWGGMIPIAGLNFDTFIPAFGAILFAFLTTLIVWSGYIVYGIWTQIRLSGTWQIRPVGQFLFLALGFLSGRPPIRHYHGRYLCRKGRARVYPAADRPVYCGLSNSPAELDGRIQSPAVSHSRKIGTTELGDYQRTTGGWHGK